MSPAGGGGQTSRQCRVGGYSWGQDITKLEFQFCRTMNSVRMYYCQKYESLLGSTREATDGFKRLALHIALTIVKHGDTQPEDFCPSRGENRKERSSMPDGTHRYGYASIVDRYAKDQTHTTRIDLNDASTDVAGVGFFV